ncbi:hypothetical protein [Streptomyces sp. AP-93]|uniref:hypothetical protein n=1 Tax=Streptomyces sp. AP-93 TaxID=2929048 RepID=UPI001FAFE7BA|nr:hypothetical protein [Streptomyces sp. AP-93]MCJ0868113.1 hypothetical protein [Streptomyces sp. AP-93]
MTERIVAKFQISDLVGHGLLVRLPENEGVGDGEVAELLRRTQVRPHGKDGFAFKFKDVPFPLANRLRLLLLDMGDDIQARRYSVTKVTAGHVNRCAQKQVLKALRDSNANAGRTLDHEIDAFDRVVIGC